MLYQNKNSQKFCTKRVKVNFLLKAKLNFVLTKVDEKFSIIKS